MGLYSRLSAADRKNFIILQTTFTILGILLIGSGVFMKIVYPKYSLFLYGRFYGFSNDPIIFGSLALFLPVLAYLGFAKGIFFKMLFFIPLIVFLVFEIMAIITGMGMTVCSKWLIDFRYPSKYDRYDYDQIMHLWDRVQTEFHCCGTYSYIDWQENLPNEFSDQLPLSCCDPPSGVSTFNCTKSGDVHISGCREPFGVFLGFVVGVPACLLLTAFIAQIASSIPLLKKIRLGCSGGGCSFSTISYQSYDCNCKTIVLVRKGCDSQNHLVLKPNKRNFSGQSDPFAHQELINENE